MAGVVAVGMSASPVAFADETEHDLYTPRDSTYSIIAVDKATGLLGLGVQSKALSIGNRSITGKGGVAIVAHQSSSNPMYGRLIIDGIERGMTPEQALEFAKRADKEPNRRQVAVIDIKGRSAAWTSPTISEWAGHKCFETFCVQGNTLMGPDVIDAMAAAFQAGKGELAERLLAALDAGQAAGGDRRGMQGAALKIVKPLARADYDDTFLDIRVDDHRAPLVELRRILGVTRAFQALGKVRGLVRKNDLSSAMTLAESALKMAPDNDLALVAIGDISLRMGKKTEALTALERAIVVNPALKGQFMRNKDFASLHKDAAFLKLVK